MSDTNEIAGGNTGANDASHPGTPIGLVILIRLARDPQIMGGRPISRRLAAAGWVVTVAVGGLGVLFVLGAALGRS